MVRAESCSFWKYIQAFTHCSVNKPCLDSLSDSVTPVEHLEMDSASRVSPSLDVGDEREGINVGSLECVKSILSCIPRNKPKLHFFNFFSKITFFFFKESKALKYTGHQKPFSFCPVIFFFLP